MKHLLKEAQVAKRRQYGGPFLDATNRTLMNVARSWRTVSLALAGILACAPITYAIPIDGDPPGDDCAAVSGNLTATPSLLDPTSGTPMVSTLTWSVVVPETCTRPLS